ncbi:hypothetical protein PENSOL_c019G00958 [Penicillium solitum]|uniref:EKC/KEOPS complex subunit GON7 n=1 Tax=Penicillium solitum TaxID=60172 RepID=A0A1V6R2R2_9EURO|nr:uncharacterized protein PENSOL_c019G00958 [Penicillium solitum]OQD95715.1 hypothetical protein PENSOL_c019G00958 [Penicillium solitum]
MASNTSLNAVYTAPQSTETFEHSLVPKLQDQINVFLTERMEEDKVQGQISAQEAKEEENYGEEVVEDDA